MICHVAIFSERLYTKVRTTLTSGGLLFVKNCFHFYHLVTLQPGDSFILLILYKYNSI